jgi:hypothetical protein
MSRASSAMRTSSSFIVKGFNIIGKPTKKRSIYTFRCDSTLQVYTGALHSSHGSRQIVILNFIHACKTKPVVFAAHFAKNILRSSAQSSGIYQSRFRGLRFFSSTAVVYYTKGFGIGRQFGKIIAQTLQVSGGSKR